MSKPGLEYLFNRYFHNNYTVEDEDDLMKLLSLPENRDAAIDLINKYLVEDNSPETQMTDQAGESILQNILKKDAAKAVSVQHKGKLFVTWRRVAAAAIFFLIAVAYWVMDKSRHKESRQDGIKTENLARILPGGNRASLTMANGKTILLNSVRNGLIAREGSARINKQDGLLVYDASATSKAVRTEEYNTLSTPRGGQFEIVLSDGTKVWLNAASSLRFPAEFIGKQRVVELKGEAYFEVTKNDQKPFQVLTENMQVNVLGTHFNVKDYADESSVRTSLLEGSVKIIQGNSSGILKPGQQAVLNRNEQGMQIVNANMDEVLAWKNGIFQFEGDDISTIMREIGRWYDVEISYAGKPPTRRFEGKISKNANLSEMLQILELSDVKFSVDGKKITVQ